MVEKCNHIDNVIAVFNEINKLKFFYNVLQKNSIELYLIKKTKNYYYYIIHQLLYIS